MIWIETYLDDNEHLQAQRQTVDLRSWSFPW